MQEDSIRTDPRQRRSLSAAAALIAMKKRLSLWLPVIFAAFHLVVVGAAFLEAGGDDGGEGLAFAIFFADLPLFVLAKAVHIPGSINPGPHNAKLFILLAGTLMYALVGFLIGAAIDWIRAFLARRQGAG